MTGVKHGLPGGTGFVLRKVASKPPQLVRRPRVPVAWFKFCESSHFYTSSMRFSCEQRSAIVAATAELAGPDARVLLFGSRVHDELRGGDIDLLVECPHPVERPVRLAMQLTARLQCALGDQRINVLDVDAATPLDGAHAEARQHGVLL